MSARAPTAIMHLWSDVHAAIPSAQLGGIVGDTAHSFGYHLARQDLPSSDYSVQLAPDKLGASDCASALDITLDPTLMKTVTQRLLTACQARDPRVKALREFCGTLNGVDTYPYDNYQHGSEGLDSWDNSHLWHVHCSFLREYADNYAALAPIADVIAGTPTPTDWLAMATKAEVQAAFLEALESPAGRDAIWGHEIKNAAGGMSRMDGLIVATNNRTGEIHNDTTALLKKATP